MRFKAPLSVATALTLAASLLFVGAVMAVSEEKRCGDGTPTGAPEEEGTQMGGAQPDKGNCPPEDPPPPPPPPPPDPCTYDYSCYPCYCYYPCYYPMATTDVASDSNSTDPSGTDMPVYWCDPCYYPMATTATSSEANASTDPNGTFVPIYWCYPCYCWYPCAYPVEDTNVAGDGSGAEAGSDSISIYYCPPCYYLDGGGETPMTDENGTSEPSGSDMPTYICDCYCPPPPCYYEVATDTVDEGAENGTVSDGLVICPVAEEPAA